MGWKERSAMSLRREFASLAKHDDANVRELCRRYGISPSTGYKWIDRAEEPGEDYQDRSRRPHHSPNKTEPTMERLVLEIRDAHPAWNARKIRRILQRRIPDGDVPAASTVGVILKRNGRICDQASEAAQRWVRFEHHAPNELSQIDFKGHFPVGNRRCYPLTMLDDHSRFSQLLRACTDERTQTVQRELIETFRRYGLPKRMNMDNGNPWGNSNGDPYTKLTVWLIRIGVDVSHSRPLHPQTNGKEERFHRTLKAELLGRRCFSTLREVQNAFDRWREVYNHERPHEALALEVPASRYQPSRRSYPEVLPPIEYNTVDLIQTIRHNGMLYVWKQDFYIGQAFAGQPVALRPAAKDGVWNVYFCHKQIATVNRKDQLTTVEAS